MRLMAFPTHHEYFGRRQAPCALIASSTKKTTHFYITELLQRNSKMGFEKKSLLTTTGTVVCTIEEKNLSSIFFVCK